MVDRLRPISPLAQPWVVRHDTERSGSLGAARRVVCARLGWDDYTPERIDFIVRTITPAVLLMFGLPAVEGDPEQGAK